MRKSNAVFAVAEMLKKCFRHLHLYPEKQTEECLVQVILPAAVLHRSMQIAPDQEVVAEEYRLKENFTNFKLDMDEYQKEQYDALLMVIEHLASISSPEKMKLRSATKDYLKFRDKVNTFLTDHFAQICTQKCYQSNLSACCSREGIITFFADVVINTLVSEKNKIEALLRVLQQPNNGFKCIYLYEQGCMWQVKPIVCEMFLCDQAAKSVFDDKPRLHEEWKSLEQQRKLFTWPDKPILFDMLESIFIDAGYHSSLMYMHNSPGLLRVKKMAQKSNPKI